ncbi:hypothetical protein B0H14DRAFT_3430573 [Mycena olivaceomarginata]|nr:hypothetical protein B0H14DRAFT_3430573 [Mycena olivaceomarginata]
MKEESWISGSVTRIYVTLQTRSSDSFRPAPSPKSTRSSSKPTKLAVLTTVAPSTSVTALKAKVLNALKDDFTSTLGDELPLRPTQTRDFELCQAPKDTRVANWEALFLRFQDAETGDLHSTEYVPYEDNDDAPSVPAPASAPSAAAATAETSTSRGKRKAHPD